MDVEQAGDDARRVERALPAGEPAVSRRRDCHFDDTPFLSLLIRLLKVEGGAAE